MQSIFHMGESDEKASVVQLFSKRLLDGLCRGEKFEESCDAESEGAC